MSACSYDPDRTLETQLNALLNEYTLQRGFVEPRFIDLAEYVPQQWDTVHVIGHYAGPSVVHDALGFWWIHSWQMMGHDFYNLLVFVDGNDVVQYSRVGYLIAPGGVTTLARESAQLELMQSVRDYDFLPTDQGISVQWLVPVGRDELYCSYCTSPDRQQSRCAEPPFIERRTCEISKDYDLPIITPVIGNAWWEQTTGFYPHHNCIDEEKVQTVAFGESYDLWGDEIGPEDLAAGDLLYANADVRSDEWVRFTLRLYANPFDSIHTGASIVIDEISTGVHGDDIQNSDPDVFEPDFWVMVNPMMSQTDVYLKRFGDNSEGMTTIQGGLQTLVDGYRVYVPVSFFSTDVLSFKFKVTTSRLIEKNISSTIRDYLPDVGLPPIAAMPREPRFNKFCADEE